MLAHFKSFLNLVSWGHLRVSYGFFKDRNVVLLFHGALAQQGLRLSAPVGQQLRHSVDGSWMSGPASGRGWHFFSLHIPHRQLLRVMCSLINLSIKLFKQAAVCCTLSIRGFVNKKNVRALT